MVGLTVNFDCTSDIQYTAGQPSLHNILYKIKLLKNISEKK
jgi:hypothetical protein